MQAFGADAEIDVSIDDAFNPPSLKHTKVLRAEVDGVGGAQGELDERAPGGGRIGG